MASRKPKLVATNGGQIARATNIVEVPIVDVLLTYDNARSGDWTQTSSREEADGNSFKELVESIQSVGQQEPVTLRQKGKKYELVVGFRRFAAVKQLAVANGTTKTATIRAVVEELDELGARLANTLENTARDNLQGPDLAYAANELSKAHHAANQPISDNMLASKMGKNQSYIAQLLRVMRMADQRIPKLWREAQVQLSVSEMDRIAKLDKPLQFPEYQRLLEGKGGGSDGQGSGKTWIDTANKKAATQGTLLGNLQREGRITTDITWDSAEDLALLGVKVKAEATARQVKAIGKVAKEAFVKALIWVAPPAKEESEESEAAE